MTRMRLFHLKNQMLIGNGLANFIGVNVAEMISHRSISPPPPEAIALFGRVDAVFMPLSFGLIFIITVVYELPIRRFLNRCHRAGGAYPGVDPSARQRLLNEPFFLIAVDFLTWIIAAVVYTSAIYRTPFGPSLALGVFSRALFVGMITTTIAFFVMEWRLQKGLVPVLFPEGGLYATRGTLRIRIGTRLAALIAAANLIPFLAFLMIVQKSFHSNYPPDQMLDQLRTTINANSLLFIALGVILTILVSSNLTRPFGDIIKVLQNVRNGRLDRRVSVRSNDEVGYMGDVINEMTEGLREREEIRESLELAREVQQNLLPKSVPSSDRVDIAGRSIYCDQTGGDYFDFMEVGLPGDNKIGLVVGDVSGHGVPSALLMATARALMRQRSLLPGGPAQVVGDVNMHLSRDVEDSGQFMTLFYLVIDPVQRSLKWVRAGHEPGVLYDPLRDVFEELRGSGVALGVDENWQYREEYRSGLLNGQVILIGTDGIWESRNSEGRMFGKDALLDLIRKNAAYSAEEILSAIIDSIKHFQQDVEPEDDITLVVAKIKTG
ncbi:MAG: SpoIIE family protein phosphatase [Desulfobacterales bacterium]